MHAYVAVNLYFDLWINYMIVGNNNMMINWVVGCSKFVILFVHGLFQIFFIFNVVVITVLL